MQIQESIAGETEADLENHSGEFGLSGEFELSEEFESEDEAKGPLDEIEEMELAEELLRISSEEELDQFLGDLFKKAWRGVKKVAAPLSGVLKGIAKKALPFVGGALGSMIPIPGVGTALGTAIGGAASKLLEVDLEGLSQEEQEFELARRYVRLAGHAAQAADAGGSDDELAGGSSPQSINAAALAALQHATARMSATPGGPHHKRQSGRWLRQGHQIVLLGV
jgi:hypothetical protein